MKAIIIAAGLGLRLRPYTEDLPKCLLPINGTPLIEHTMELMRTNGIDDISVIRGYKREKLTFPGVTFFDNRDFANNNILQSLLYARPKLDETLLSGDDVIISYSDIWYDDYVIKELLRSRNDIAIVVDTDWEKIYVGRVDHPVEQAENVLMDNTMKVVNIGKHIVVDGKSTFADGEFIGLWKFTSDGLTTFLTLYDQLDNQLDPTMPYQQSKEWQKSYITDIFQGLIDKGTHIHGVPIEGHWREYDTVEDYERIID